MFRGEVPLITLSPGFAQVDIVGVDRRYEAIVLLRSSWLQIMRR